MKLVNDGGQADAWTFIPGTTCFSSLGPVLSSGPEGCSSKFVEGKPPARVGPLRQLSPPPTYATLHQGHSALDFPQANYSSLWIRQLSLYLSYTRSGSILTEKYNEGVVLNENGRSRLVSKWGVDITVINQRWSTQKNVLLLKCKEKKRCRLLLSTTLILWTFVSVLTRIQESPSS